MNQPVTTGLTPELPICTIFCIGRNYAEHARELNNEVPKEPVVFLKPASSIIAGGDTILLPARSNEIHHEVELVAAIGKRGKHIPAEQAADHIAGYALGIDVTARDIQQRAKENGHPWSVAKGFDTFAPLSRFIPSKRIDHPQDLELELKVNGEIRQHDSTAKMLNPVADLVSYLSGIFTLNPGDLIFTGTPKGVSSIAAGDHIEARLGDDLLTLSVDVKNES